MSGSAAPAQPAAWGIVARIRNIAERIRHGSRGRLRSSALTTSAFRLTVGYSLLLTLAIGVTLGSAYLFTERLIADELDEKLEHAWKGRTAEVRS